MTGVYLVEVKNTEQVAKIQEILATLNIENYREYKIEQFHDNAEGEECVYNVYKISGIDKEYVLKKSCDEEIYIYKDLLENHSFSVPHFCNSIQDKKGVKWILIEYIPGEDLRLQ